MSTLFLKNVVAFNKIYIKTLLSPASLKDWCYNFSIRDFRLSGTASMFQSIIEGGGAPRELENERDEGPVSSLYIKTPHDYSIRFWITRFN